MRGLFCAISLLDKAPQLSIECFPVFGGYYVQFTVGVLANGTQKVRVLRLDCRQNVVIAGEYLEYGLLKLGRSALQRADLIHYDETALGNVPKIVGARVIHKLGVADISVFAQLDYEASAALGYVFRRVVKVYPRHSVAVLRQTAGDEAVGFSAHIGNEAADQRAFSRMNVAADKNFHFLIAPVARTLEYETLML